MTIKVQIKSNDNPDYKTTLTLDISEREALILKRYELDEYDELWDRLITRIEREYPQLDPDWYIDYLQWGD